MIIKMGDQMGDNKTGFLPVFKIPYILHLSYDVTSSLNLILCFLFKINVLEDRKYWLFVTRSAIIAARGIICSGITCRSRK